ncbi:hypothetical protein HU200_062502 [Digitaria exilis]|uniref:PUM-HD domain-containing protein n=1 Tax=Digitaria exilis TaxID=1010633 RepID=A0A835AFC0_9POAL|nr:hypothetical protein HU200_062502 [Digitaria exilis]
MTDANRSTKGKEAAVDDFDKPDDNPLSDGSDGAEAELTHRWHGHHANHRSIAGTNGAGPFANPYSGYYVNYGASAGSSLIGGTVVFPSSPAPHVRNYERHNTSYYQAPNNIHRPRYYNYKEQLNTLIETSQRSLTIRDRGRRNNLSRWVNRHGQQQQEMPDGHNAGGGQAHAAGASSTPADADPYVGRRLGDVRGTMSSAARSLNGCRFLVRMVAEGRAAAARQVLDEVAGEIVRLMVDSVAHKLVEKLVEHLADDQITRVLHILAASPGQIVTVARNHAGSDILQTLVDRIAGNPRHVELFTSALAHTGEHAVALLIQHADGSRLIIRCLDMFSAYQNRVRFDFNLSIYGNYVVQQVIRSVPEARDCLHATFRGQYVSLSRQAASSHVVQRCLELFCSEHVDEIIRELLGCHHWGCRFPQLISDPYANYVLQTAMGRREVRMHNALLDAINMHRSLLQDDRIAREVFRTLRKAQPSLFHI